MCRAKNLLMTAALAAVILTSSAADTHAAPQAADSVTAVSETGAAAQADPAEETGGGPDRKGYLIRSGAVLGAGAALYAVVSVRSRRS